MAENSELAKQVDDHSKIDALKDIDFDSFVVLKLQRKIMPTKYPELFILEYTLLYQWNMLKIDYRDKSEDTSDGVNKLWDTLEEIDEKQYFEITFKTDIDFSSQAGQRLLSLFEFRRVGRIDSCEIILSKKSMKALIRYLATESCQINAVRFKMPNDSLIPDILRALDNNLFINYLELNTDKKVSQEVEQMALDFLEPRIGLVIELNSQHKLFRRWEERGVTKYLEV
jgi:hypothetical protein